MLVTPLGIVMLVKLLQLEKAESPMLVTPCSIMTVRTSPVLQGLLFSVEIVPLPEMVRVPWSSRVQVRLAPQVPLSTVSAAKAVAGSMEKTMHSTNKKEIIRFFIIVPPKVLWFYDSTVGEKAHGEQVLFLKNC